MIKNLLLAASISIVGCASAATDRSAIVYPCLEHPGGVCVHYPGTVNEK